jgi:hypothetical protein
MLPYDIELQLLRPSALCNAMSLLFLTLSMLFISLCIKDSGFITYCHRYTDFSIDSGILRVECLLLM